MGDADPPDPIQIATYSVQSFPAPIQTLMRLPPNHPRMEMIPGAYPIAYSDIVVFTAAFSSAAKRALAGDHRLHYTAQPSRSWAPLTGGVFISARTPFKYEASRVFHASCGVDLFATKGFVYVETVVRGQAVAVLGAHLQSGSGCLARFVRQRQLRQIRRFLDRRRNERGGGLVPVVVAGDMNVDMENHEYDDMLKALRARPPLVERQGDWRSWDPTTNLHAQRRHPDRRAALIDYVVALDDDDAGVQVANRTVAVESGYVGPLEDLSEHHAVVGTVSITSSNKYCPPEQA
ncbi:Endonuclease/exonuclease/phosphatase domain-containing protein [Plasmodiophora brassicae]